MCLKGNTTFEKSRLEHIRIKRRKIKQLFNISADFARVTGINSICEILGGSQAGLNLLKT